MLLQAAAGLRGVHRFHVAALDLFIAAVQFFAHGLFVGFEQVQRLGHKLVGGAVLTRGHLLFYAFLDVGFEIQRHAHMLTQGVRERRPNSADGTIQARSASVRGRPVTGIPQPSFVEAVPFSTATQRWSRDREGAVASNGSIVRRGARLLTAFLSRPFAPFPLSPRINPPLRPRPSNCTFPLFPFFGHVKLLP